MQFSIPIIILAAGASSRMGRIKQILPWEDTNLLGKAIHTAKQSNGSNVFVVLGANAKIIKEQISKEVTCIENLEWESGMGSSIARGVNHILANTKEVAGILIMLCDQPLITSDHLNKLITTFTGNNKGIVGTAYNKKIGVPSIFGSVYFADLQSLKDDYGAKDILKNNSDDCISINTDAKVADIDTLEDYDKLRKGST